MRLQERQSSGHKNSSPTCLAHVLVAVLVVSVFGAVSATACTWDLTGFHDMTCQPNQVESQTGQITIHAAANFTTATVEIINTVGTAFSLLTPTGPHQFPHEVAEDARVVFNAPTDGHYEAELHVTADCGSNFITISGDAIGGAFTLSSVPATDMDFNLAAGVIQSQAIIFSLTTEVTRLVDFTLSDNGGGVFYCPDEWCGYGTGYQMVHNGPGHVITVYCMSQTDGEFTGSVTMTTGGVSHVVHLHAHVGQQIPDFLPIGQNIRMWASTMTGAGNNWDLNGAIHFMDNNNRTVVELDNATASVDQDAVTVDVTDWGTAQRALIMNALRNVTILNGFSVNAVTGILNLNGVVEIAPNWTISGQPLHLDVSQLLATVDPLSTSMFQNLTIPDVSFLLTDEQFSVSATRATGLPRIQTPDGLYVDLDIGAQATFTIVRNQTDAYIDLTTGVSSGAIGTTAPLSDVELSIVPVNAGLRFRAWPYWGIDIIHDTDIDFQVQAVEGTMTLTSARDPNDPDHARGLRFENGSLVSNLHATASAQFSGLTVQVAEADVIVDPPAHRLNIHPTVGELKIGFNNHNYFSLTGAQAQCSYVPGTHILHVEGDLIRSQDFTDWPRVDLLNVNGDLDQSTGQLLVDVNQDLQLGYFPLADHEGQIVVDSAGVHAYGRIYADIDGWAMLILQTQWLIPWTLLPAHGVISSDFALFGWQIAASDAFFNLYHDRGELAIQVYGQWYYYTFQRPGTLDNIQLASAPNGPLLMPFENFDRLRVQSHSQPTTQFIEYSREHGWHQVGLDGIEFVVDDHNGIGVPVVRKGTNDTQDLEAIVYGTHPQFGFCRTGDEAGDHTLIRNWDRTTLANADSIKYPLGGDSVMCFRNNGLMTVILPDTTASLVTDRTTFAIIGESGWWQADGTFRYSATLTDSAMLTCYFAQAHGDSLIQQTPRATHHEASLPNVNPGWIYRVTATDAVGHVVESPWHIVPQMSGYLMTDQNELVFHPTALNQLVWDTLVVRNLGAITSINAINGVHDPFLGDVNNIGQPIQPGQTRNLRFGADVTAFGIYCDTVTIIYDSSQALTVILRVEVIDEAGKNKAILPTVFSLHTPYPNPFNPTTTVAYDLPQATTVLLTIYDVLGRQVRVLENAAKPAGSYTLTWDARDDHGESIPSGMYVIRIKTKLGNTMVQKALLVR